MMQGFSDREPENWDMAVGTVRGYRWWNLLVPATSNAVPYVTRALDSWHGLSWTPLAGRCQIQGMHGGQWARTFSENGRYRARCTADNFRYFSSAGLSNFRHVSETIEAGCGCGFWAYWKELPMEWDACVPYARRDSADGYHLTLPLAGVIEGSGKTVIGERGFRCEYARVTDLALSLDGDCVYYNSYGNYVNYAGGSFAFGTPAFPFGCTPENYGSFASFAERELHTDSGVMRDVLKAAVRKILGEDATWHQNIPDLMRNCPPDENYADGC